MPVRLIALFLACNQVLAAAAPVSFVAQPARAQLRAAAANADGSLLYLAAYDRDGVWVFDAGTLEREREIPVGDGPAALALSADGTLLAVANRLGNSVSLIATATNTVSKTVDLPDAPGAMAALPGGGWVVASSFGDTVATVSMEGTVPRRVTVPRLTPTGIAASGGHVLVIGRGAVSAALLTLPQLMPGPAVPLPGQPRAVAALPGGRFAIATEAGTVLVRGEDGAVLARNGQNYSTLAAHGSALFGLRDNVAAALDSNLNETSTTALAEPAALLAAGPGLLLALAPAERMWQAARITTEPGTVAAAPPPPPAPPPTPQPAAPEPEPVIVEAPRDTEPVVVVETPPTDDTAQVEDETAQAAPPPAPAQERAPAPLARADDGEDTGEAEAETMRRRSRRMPLSTAPSMDPGMMPSASPLHRIDRQSLAEAFLQPTEFGSLEAGFQPPDWREPFRDIEANTMRQELGSDRTTLTGNVHMNLGEMHFRADEFVYSKSGGDLTATGNVSIDQQASRLRASYLSYRLPPEEEVLQATPILVSGEDDQRLARERLTLGRIHAQQVLVEEPTRQMTAEEIDFDFFKTQGEMLNVRGRAGVLYYHADCIHVHGPDHIEADNVWVTTCDHDPPHYRIMHKHATFEDGALVGGTHGRLQIGKRNTPLWVPKWRRPGTGAPWAIDFDSGRRAALGSHLNVGVGFGVTPDIVLGPRLVLTEKEGVGFGGDLTYDFMKNPASPLFRTAGELHGFHTTANRGHVAWFHRWEPEDRLVIRMQAEQWSDQEFYKDFFYDEYRHRSEPRTFANVTFREDTYIATGTVRMNTHSWVRETERLPEVTFHLLERPIAEKLYLTFDTVTGYNKVRPRGPGAVRSVNVARLTYSVDQIPWLSITPYAELELTAYSKGLDDSGAEGRIGGIVGTTLQSRLHRAYEGRFGFDGFKHLIVPSTTISYRPKSSMEFNETPRFDAYDNALGRVRVESKLDNILYGRDAQTGQSWQVGRLSLYHGNDLWNEEVIAHDYEMEFDIRPRPWWGIQGVAERHRIQGDRNLELAGARLTNFLLDAYEGATGRRYRDSDVYRYNQVFADYDRVLAHVYYDDTTIGGRLMGRVGFAYTETGSRTFNRDLLYGFGVQASENWFLRFEHILDLENGGLRQQTYEVRRALHCWEVGLRFRDRRSGFDVDVEFGIRAFPGSRLRF